MAPRAVEVFIETGDRTVGSIQCGLMILNLEFEVLISDRLGGGFGIVILDLRGKWRFSDENVIREIEPPQYWL